MSDRPERFVFIVTYGRSGSTLLQNLLNAIPGYQIRGENNNALFFMMQAWHSINSSGPLVGMRKAGTTSDPTHPWYGGEDIDPDRLGQTLANGFVETVLNPDPGVRVSGFKEIRFHSNPKAFVQYLNFIHTYFPHARFIFNTRDHASVAKSGWWASRPTRTVFEILTAAEKLYQGYLDQYPDRGLLMHYDDYVAEAAALRPMYDFLGEVYDAETVEKVMSHKLTHARRGNDTSSKRA